MPHFKLNSKSTLINSAKHYNAEQIALVNIDDHTLKQYRPIQIRTARRRGDIAKCTKYLRTAYKLPNDTVPCEIAILYMLRGDYNRASIELLKGDKSSPRIKNVYFYIQLAQTRDPQSIYEKSLKGEASREDEINAPMKNTQRILFMGRGYKKYKPWHESAQ